jgi:hypothetical protein
MDDDDDSLKIYSYSKMRMKIREDRSFYKKSWTNRLMNILIWFE